MRRLSILAAVGLLALPGCGGQEGASPDAGAPTAEAPASRHASNVPPMGPTNIVRLAQASEDHTTLVQAIEAADYVTAVAASGPLTVFAPTNAAFEALPPGTVESLLEPENADQLREILKYHVTTSSLAARSFRDGQKLGMANGAKATMRVEGDQVWINDAKVIASIPAENGMLHVIDAVLLPPEGS
ncbi:MAG TPA: fasciclin domain-containing protein [Myxococcota bacterium]|nr:fasciclin domain-containing protein [Myxococcota bacterium]